MKLDLEIDVDGLKEAIAGASKLDSNFEVFKQLSSVAHAKKQVADLLEQVEVVEAEAKGLINSKATALYGPAWTAIAGEGYKITRSPTGSVYTRAPDVPVDDKFVEVKEVLLTKEIDAEIEKTGKLPEGIELNPSRGTSIRITVK